MKLEKAQNELESFIISSQEKLYDDLWQKCSTEEERENIAAKLSAASDWLYEVDETTPRKVKKTWICWPAVLQVSSFDPIEVMG